MALAGLTAACASVEPSAPPTPVVSAAAPAPIPGYDWFLSEDEGTARLAYGIEASDELKLGLDCIVGTGKVDLVRSLGWIAQWVDGERTAYAPQPGSEVNVERFFAFCD
jgi:hypothetical protein